MKKYVVIANINIKKEFMAKDEDEAIEKMENIELPNGYVEDSFEIVKTIKE